MMVWKLSDTARNETDETVPARISTTSDNSVDHLEQENARLCIDADRMDDQLRAHAEELDKLQAQNDRLRRLSTELSMLDANGAISCAKCGRQARAIRDDLETENAELRKLVQDMIDYGEGAGNGMAEFFADRIRELRIEANE